MEHTDDVHKILFILSYMKEGAATAWVTQKVDYLLTPNTTNPTLDEFIQELETMFADPNHKASACQKLSKAQQGNGPVNIIIQLFKLYGPPSKLGGAGLIDKFKCTISYHLHHAIYCSYPLPQMWEEWKERASILDNQLHCFDYTQMQFCQGHPIPNPPTSN